MTLRELHEQISALVAEHPMSGVLPVAVETNGDVVLPVEITIRNLAGRPYAWIATTREGA